MNVTNTSYRTKESIEERDFFKNNCVFTHNRVLGGKFYGRTISFIRSFKMFLSQYSPGDPNQIIVQEELVIHVMMNLNRHCAVHIYSFAIRPAALGCEVSSASKFWWRSLKLFPLGTVWVSIFISKQSSIFSRKHSFAWQ